MYLQSPSYNSSCFQSYEQSYWTSSSVTSTSNLYTSSANRNGIYLDKHSILLPFKWTASLNKSSSSLSSYIVTSSSFRPRFIAAVRSRVVIELVLVSSRKPGSSFLLSWYAFFLNFSALNLGSTFKLVFLSFCDKAHHDLNISWEMVIFQWHANGYLLSPVPISKNSHR